MPLGSRRAMKRRVVDAVYRFSARTACSSPVSVSGSAPRSTPAAVLHTLTKNCQPRASADVSATGTLALLTLVPESASNSHAEYQALLLSCVQAWQSHHVFKVAAAALGVGGLTGFGTGYGVGTTNFGYGQLSTASKSKHSAEAKPQAGVLAGRTCQRQQLRRCGRAGVVSACT